MTEFSNFVKYNLKKDRKPIFLQFSVYQAVKDDNIDKLKLLLQNVSDIKKLENDTTPLLYVAIETKCQMEMFKLLLQHGADLSSATPEIIQSINDLTQRCRYALETVHLTITTLIRLKKLNLVSEKQFSNCKLLDLYQRSDIQIIEKISEPEARELEKELICEKQSFTFADILTKNLQTVTGYLNINDVKERVTEIKFDLEFPVYSELLRQRIDRAINLTEVLSMGVQSLKCLLGDRRLSDKFLYQILSYLTERDIKILNAHFFKY